MIGQSGQRVDTRLTGEVTLPDYLGFLAGAESVQRVGEEQAADQPGREHQLRFHNVLGWLGLRLRRRDR